MGRRWTKGVPWGGSLGRSWAEGVVKLKLLAAGSPSWFPPRGEAQRGGSSMRAESKRAGAPPRRSEEEIEYSLSKLSTYAGPILIHSISPSSSTLSGYQGLSRSRPGNPSSHPLPRHVHSKPARLSRTPHSLSSTRAPSSSHSLHLPVLPSSRSPSLDTPSLDMPSTASQTLDEPTPLSPLIPFGTANPESYLASREAARAAAVSQGFEETTFVEQPVRWGDCDANNHVNNCVYFKWLEVS